MTNQDQFPIGPSAEEVAQLTEGQQAMAGMIVHQEAQLALGTVPNEYDALFAPADASDLSADIHNLVHGTDDLGRTVADAAVRTPAKTGIGANLYTAEQGNKDAAGKGLGLDTQQYEAARSQGLLRPTVGNPGEISRLSDERRDEIVTKIS